MALWVKAFATKPEPNDLNSVLRTHMVEEEKWLLQVFL